MKLFLISILFIFSCTSQSKHRRENILEKNELSQKTNSTISSQWFSIKKFVDGDTFWIDDGSEKGLKIRLIGVDTPENKARFGNPKEFYGTEASEFTKKMLKGKKVRLEFDIDKYDSFGRTLAYVFLEDGTFLNEELVKQGYANIMTVQPNSKYADRFYSLQVQARNAKIGLWSE